MKSILTLTTRTTKTTSISLYYPANSFVLEHGEEPEYSEVLHRQTEEDREENHPEFKWCAVFTIFQVTSVAFPERRNLAALVFPGVRTQILCERENANGANDLPACPLLCFAASSGGICATEVLSKPACLPRHGHNCIMYGQGTKYLLPQGRIKLKDRDVTSAGTQNLVVAAMHGPSVDLISSFGRRSRLSRL